MTRPTAKYTGETVRLATTEPIDLETATEIDGVELGSSDVVLVKDQENLVENGLYRVRRGRLVRPLDGGAAAPQHAVVSGQMLTVQEGEENADKTFILTTDNPIVLDETELVFEEFAAGGGGGGVELDGNNVWTGTNFFQQNVDFGDFTNESYLQAGAGRLKMGGPNSFILMDGSSHTGNVVYKAEVAGDDFNRFKLYANGMMQWGSGDSDLDADLYRSEASTLRTGGHFKVGGQLTVGALDMDDSPISNVTDPTLPQDAATKKYVDDHTSGSPLVMVARQTAPQSIDADDPPVFVPVVFDALVSEDWTTPTPGEYEVPEAGLFEVSSTVTMSTPSPGNSYAIRLLVDGGEVFKKQFIDNNNGPIPAGSDLTSTMELPPVPIEFVGGEVIKIEVSFNESAPLDTVAGLHTSLTVKRIAS